MTAAIVVGSKPGLLAVERARVLLADAGEIILRADVRLGELARELPRAAGPGRGNKTSPTRGGLLGKEAALKAAGVAPQRGREFEKVAKLPAKQLEQYIATERKHGRAPSTAGAVALARMPENVRGKALAKLGDLGDLRKVVNEIRRDERIAKLNEVSKNEKPLTGELGRFPILYADPPWRYEHIETESRMRTGKIVLIDEKVRFRNQNGLCFEDIALETWSDFEKETPGWIVKPLLADYIAYAILPLGRCHLFPVPQLQSAWRLRGADWRKDYPTIRAVNEGYWTECVCIPADVLYRAIGSCFRTTFAPTDERFEAP